MSGVGLPGAVELGARAAAYRPQAQGEPWAATALILGGNRDGPAILLIRRTTRAGDRWSGHMALPGGKRDPGEDAAATAVRETFEEVGIALASPAGRLDDQRGRSSSARVATFVFTVDGLPAPVPEPLEVDEVLWIPVWRLLDPASEAVHRWGGVVPAPAWQIDGATIWGLTHRILLHFFEVTRLL